jgi:hypothetical protein
LAGIDADNVNCSRFPRYLHHLCGTTWSVAHGLAVPQWFGFGFSVRTGRCDLLVMTVQPLGQAYTSTSRAAR